MTSSTTNAWWRTLNVERLPLGNESSEQAALRHVLSRLGDYAELLVRPLQVRPTSAAIIEATIHRVRVRISTPTANVTLVVSPSGELTSDVFFLRSLARHNVRVPQLLAHDLTCAAVPFGYLIHSHSAGVPLSSINEPTALQLAARQVGRQLRHIHNVPAPHYGAPTVSGRWSGRTWVETVDRWLTTTRRAEYLARILDGPTFDRLRAATVLHPEFGETTPHVTHGALSPAAILVTRSEQLVLEALIDPGPIVGGDPFFDLALALTPSQPAAFRRGVFEGYTAGGSPGDAALRRLQRIQLLLNASDIGLHGDADAVQQLPDAVLAALARLGG